jgi:large subunit ribosomal protein L32
MALRLLKRTVTSNKEVNTMAVPKKRLGRSDQGHRRAHWKANILSFNICPNCGSPKESHTVCMVCGFYKDGIVSERFARKSGYANMQASHSHDHAEHAHEDSGSAVATEVAEPEKTEE